MDNGHSLHINFGVTVLTVKLILLSQVYRPVDKGMDIIFKDNLLTLKKFISKQKIISLSKKLYIIRINGQNMINKISIIT